MTKTTGLGDRLYLNGRDLSGDVGAINEVSGGPAVIDTTHATKDAIERIGAALSGKLVFDAYHNTALAHAALAQLPVTDGISTYVRGIAATAPCAGLVAKQVDYPGSRGTDGSLHFAITMLSDLVGVEWGTGYVGGVTRTDTAGTTGTSVDDGASSSTGLTAYLQVITFTGTNAEIALEHSTDDGVSDTYTPIIVFTSVGTAPSAQRIATLSILTVKRWLRVRTSGVFSFLKFHVMALRQALSGTEGYVTVDVQVFTSSGTWTKPAGVTTTYVLTVGGGGGGGRGLANNVAVSGASGGGGGAYSSQLFPTSALGATETVLVGAGGVGAPLGGNPTAGGSSKFGTVVKVTSSGGLQGVNGSNVGRTGGVGGSGEQAGGAGGDTTVGASGNSGAVINLFSASGGGGGGGHDAVPTGFNGGNGGASFQNGVVGFGGAGTVGVAGGAATGTTANTPGGGQGGGGGGGNGAADAGSGGAGGIYGGGGGGGGACAAGFNYGLGGAGAGGIVVAVSW